MDFTRIALFLLLPFVAIGQTTEIIGKADVLLINGPVEQLPRSVIDLLGDNVLFWDVENKIMTSADIETTSGLVEMKLGDANGGSLLLGQSDITTIRPDVNYTNNSTSLTSVPGFTFMGSPGEKYHFEAQLAVAGNSSSDSRWRVSGGEGYYSVTNAENAVSQVKDIGVSTNNIPLSNASTTTGDKIVITGIIEFTQAGSFEIEARLNSGSNTLTIYDGFIRYDKL